MPRRDETKGNTFAKTALTVRKKYRFFLSSTLISHGTQIQSRYNHPHAAQAGNPHRADWPFAGVFRRPLQMVIGREWCRRSIDSRIYTAENWRPLIEHTICWSRPQVIRQYDPLFALAYFAFVQRAPSQFVVFHAHHPRRTGFEPGINTLSATLHCDIGVGLCCDASRNSILSVAKSEERNSKFWNRNRKYWTYRIVFFIKKKMYRAFFLIIFEIMIGLKY